MLKQMIPRHKWNKWIMKNDFLLKLIWYWNRIMEIIILLFYEELDKVKFSLSGQYSCCYNSFNNI